MLVLVVAMALVLVLMLMLKLRLTPLVVDDDVGVDVYDEIDDNV